MSGSSRGSGQDIRRSFIAKLLEKGGVWTALEAEGLRLIQAEVPIEIGFRPYAYMISP